MNQGGDAAGVWPALRRLFVAVLALLWALTPVEGSAPTRAQTAPSRPVYLVLIVLDGARPDYFNVPNLPHIDALRKRGTWYSSAWSGILQSVTPAGHAAIGTGTNPSKTGLLGFGWPDDQNQWVSLYHVELVRGGVIHQMIRQSGTPTIAGRVHLMDRSAKVVGLGGYKFYANDALAGPYADAVMYFADTKKEQFVPRFMPGQEPPPAILSNPQVRANTTWAHLAFGEGNHLAMQLAATTFQTMHQRVTLMNLPESDMPLGHILGADRDKPAVTKLMQGFDRDLGHLESVYKKAGVLDDTVFVLTADHGMSPLDHMISQARIRRVVQSAGTDVAHGVYQTGGYLWLTNPGRAMQAGQAIAKAFPRGVQSVYVRHSPGTGYVPAGSGRFHTPGVDAANRYLLASFAGTHAPDVVVLFDEGTAGQRDPKIRWKGDHAGADWAAQHIPLLIAGPGVRNGYTSSYPARSIDIAPTGLSLLGASPLGMEGLPLADGMTSPSPAALTAQQQQGAVLAPLVASLRAESAIERKLSTPTH